MSIENYGIWIIISAIPSYLLMADLGLSSAASNRMAIQVAKGDHLGANETFATALSLVAPVCLFSATLAAACTFLIAKFTSISSQVLGAAFLLILVVLMNLLSALVETVCRASGRYGFGSAASSTFRLTEWIGGIIGLSISPSLVGAALGMFVARAISTLTFLIYTKYKFQDFTWRIRRPERKHLAPLLVPSFGFLVLPLAYAISIQGMTLLIGLVLGASAVAVFNTLRTISRIPIQLMALLTKSIWPSISIMYAKNEISLLRSAVRRTEIWGTASCALACLAIYVFQSQIVSFWAHGKLSLDPVDLLLFLLSAIVGCAYQAPATALLATNKHLPFALVSCGSAGLAVAIAYPASRYLGIRGSIIAGGLGELAVLIAVSLMYRRIIMPSINSNRRKL